MKPETLAILFLRLMSVYVGLSGLQSLRHSQATFEILDFWQVMGMLSLTIGLPVVVAFLLWCVSPWLARRFFSFTPGQQELNTAISPTDLLIVGIKLVAIVTILEGLPNFLAHSVAVYQYTQAELEMANQIVIWWFVGFLQLVVGFCLVVFTRRFTGFISDK